jgi:hypothetical protein
MKYTYIILYKEANMAKDLANMFLRTIIANYRIPDKIILDRDKLFTSKF